MWPKRAIDWVEDGTAFVSVPFTWDLPGAYSQCVFLKRQGYRVKIGGPAVDLMPDYLEEWDLDVEIGGEANALEHHNPNATFTSRGCIRKCKFCAVPKTEGDLVELDYWEPKPIICDNNLLACSKAHFDKVIDSLRGLEDVDFNQGLDARLLTQHHADRIAELDCHMVRFAWDKTAQESIVIAAIEKMRGVGIPKKKLRLYVLIGHEDTPEDALYRLKTIKQLGVSPSVMRFQPLYALRRNEYVAPGWSERELRRFIAYWSRQSWAYGGIPFEEWRIEWRGAGLRGQRAMKKHSDLLPGIEGG